MIQSDAFVVKTCNESHDDSSSSIIAAHQGRSSSCFKLKQRSTGDGLTAGPLSSSNTRILISALILTLDISQQASGLSHDLCLTAAVLPTPLVLFCEAFLYWIIVPEEMFGLFVSRRVTTVMFWIIFMQKYFKQHCGHISVYCNGLLSIYFWPCSALKELFELFRTGRSLGMPGHERERQEC